MKEWDRGFSSLCLFKIMTIICIHDTPYDKLKFFNFFKMINRLEFSIFPGFSHPVCTSDICEITTSVVDNP